MASVRRRGAGWQATYRGPDGRERTRTFPRKVDADRWVTDEIASINRGTWIDPRAGKVMFGEFAESWRTAQVHRPTTAAQVETNLRLHVLPTFERRPLSSIRPTEVQSWVRKLEGTLQPATVGIVYAYVSSIFKAAVRDRLIASSPCIGVKLPKVEPHRVEPLATEVVERLIEAVPDRYRALVILGAGTGLRQGEAFGLTTDRVDFLRRTLTVDRQLVLMPGQDPYLAPPKTQASYRTIPLAQVVVDALAAHLAAYPAEGGFIFTNTEGRPIRRTRFSVMWRPAVKAACAPGGTGFHALRHYYASLLIRHGESVKTVQALLGHKDATETLNTYSHLWPDSDERARQAVDSILGSAADISRTSEAEQG